jgi:hypothetical protein
MVRAAPRCFTRGTQILNVSSTGISDHLFVFSVSPWCNPVLSCCIERTVIFRLIQIGSGAVSLMTGLNNWLDFRFTKTWEN